MFKLQSHTFRCLFPELHPISTSGSKMSSTKNDLEKIHQKNRKSATLLEALSNFSKQLFLFLSSQRFFLRNNSRCRDQAPEWEAHYFLFVCLFVYNVAFHNNEKKDSWICNRIKNASCYLMLDLSAVNRKWLLITGWLLVWQSLFVTNHKSLLHTETVLIFLREKKRSLLFPKICDS